MPLLTKRLYDYWTKTWKGHLFLILRKSILLTDFLVKRYMYIPLPTRKADQNIALPCWWKACLTLLMKRLYLPAVNDACTCMFKSIPIHEMENHLGHIRIYIKLYINILQSINSLTNIHTLHTSTRELIGIYPSYTSTRNHKHQIFACKEWLVPLHCYSPYLHYTKYHLIHTFNIFQSYMRSSIFWSTLQWDKNIQFTTKYMKSHACPRPTYVCL